MAEVVFRARMVESGSARAYGWMVALALLAGATPVVMLIQGMRPSTGVLIACIAAAIGLGVGAFRAHRGAAHEVSLERRADDVVLIVEGPAMHFELAAPFDVRAHYAEIVTPKRMTIPVHALVLHERGAPVLVLQEAMGVGSAHRGWPPLAETEVLPEVETLVKVGAPIHLERLRDALRPTAS